MLEYIAEFLGSVLILWLGNASVCNALLNKSSNQGQVRYKFLLVEVLLL